MNRQDGVAITSMNPPTRICISTWVNALPFIARRANVLPLDVRR